MASQVFGMIILFVIALFLLYLVIYTAVKDAINKSVVGQAMERTNKSAVHKESFFDDDLDN